MTLNRRWTAIHTGHPHYLDHLGVLCIKLGLPLLVTEDSTALAAKVFYPKLEVKQVDLQDLSLEYLATNFDVIFESGHLWTLELLPMIELMFNKKLRMIYCPHGNSDKGHTQNPVPKDISLFYGPHMRDHLKRTGAKLNGSVSTGNYRYTYYRDHQAFYDDALQPYLQKLDPAKKNIFYAPSWPDGENASSFLSSCARVIEEVGEFFNVLIRWHPFLDDIYPVETQQLLGRYEKKTGIVFLNDFPCIYPILQASDAYLGDFSSVGYDFLAFNRPLFFLDSHFGILYKCGIQLPLEKHWGKEIFQYEDTAYFKRLREQANQYVFGMERKGAEILRDLKEALSKDRAPWQFA